VTVLPGREAVAVRRTPPLLSLVRTGDSHHVRLGETITVKLVEPIRGAGRGLGRALGIFRLPSGQWGHRLGGTVFAASSRGLDALPLESIWVSTR